MRLFDLLKIIGVSLLNFVMFFAAGMGILVAMGVALLLMFSGISAINYLNTGKIFPLVFIPAPKKGERT